MRNHHDACKQGFHTTHFTPMALTRALFTACAILISGAAIADDAAPRAVTPRGEFTADERNNIDVFKASAPSVVHITTLKQAASFFSLDVQQIPKGTGTGFIWDKEGDIVTNFHVIEGGDAARVTLADQSSYSATLVGAFPDRDLAVLRIKAPVDRLKPIAIGRSADLVVGQKVFAIGNPFGLDQTLTTGIVSALGREIESVTHRTIKGVIQTDAAINPGNSGGPLLDSAGRLIGVNTQIFSPSGASAGIGFAIPVDEVNRVVPRLIRDGRYVRPGLGISAVPPAYFNQELGLPEGVAIGGLTRNGAAAQAGLKPFMRDNWGNIRFGDVLLAINGKPVKNYDQMMETLEAYKIGDRVSLKIWRNGNTSTLTVKLSDGSQ